MEYEIELKSDEKRIRPKNSEVERLLADNSKARRILKWKPKYANLEGLKRGLSKTINWFTKPGNLSFYKAKIYNL